MTVRKVALIIRAGVQALDVAGPLDVFTEANRFVDAADGYECVLVGEHVEPVQASNGMPLSAHLSFKDAFLVFDTVLVAGGPAMPYSGEDPATSSWLRRWGTLARRYGSICTGAFALGHAGLLDGRTVTTHWQHAGELAERFPGARVERDRIYARDGELVTSAGVTAGIDMALALVGEDHGPAVALSCAKRLVVVSQRQGGQSQFSPLLMPVADGDAPLARIQTYITEHLDEAFPVARLAEIAGSSARSVARWFERERGITPHDFVEGIRIDQARRLLEGTDLALKIVAHRCGFAGADHMRTAFRRRLGLSPGNYRRSFGVRRA